MKPLNEADAWEQVALAFGATPRKPTKGRRHWPLLLPPPERTAVTGRWDGMCSVTSHLFWRGIISRRTWAKMHERLRRAIERSREVTLYLYQPYQGPPRVRYARIAAGMARRQA